MFNAAMCEQCRQAANPLITVAALEELRQFLDSQKTLLREEKGLGAESSSGDLHAPRKRFRPVAKESALLQQSHLGKASGEHSRKLQGVTQPATSRSSQAGTTEEE
jgi:hypothetical protein